MTTGTHVTKRRSRTNALPKPPLSIFLSYRSTDAAAANEIKGALETLGAANLRVWASCSPDSLSAGEMWREKIRVSLHQCDRLILLYTDPAETWDWCLYETGFFDGRGDILPNRRIYVLHSCEVTPPSPLAGLETVPIGQESDEKLEGLLESIFLKSTDPPVNPKYQRFNPNFQGIRDAIVSPFRSQGQVQPPVYFVKKIDITVRPGAGAALTDEQLDKAIVRGDAESLELLDRRPNPAGHEWGKIRQGLAARAELTTMTGANSTTMWIEALHGEMRKVLNHSLVTCGLPLFRTPFGDKGTYRPTLAAYQRANDGSVRFEIVFTDLPPELDSYPPGALGRVSQLLHLARMFRWGILERYGSGFHTRLATAEVRTQGDRLVQAISNVTAESANRGVRSREEVLEAFHAGADRDTIQEALDRWPPLADTLQKAVDACDVQGILASLGELRRLNAASFRVLAARYAELLNAALDSAREE